MKCRIRFLSVTYLFRIVFIAYSEMNVTGMLTLSPMTVAPVCHVRDQLQLICKASVEFLRWNVLRVNEQGVLADVINSEIINSRDMVQMKITSLNSATLTFMRTSTQGASPLISTLSIDSVSIGLNGTVVRCSDVANPMTSASTTIRIINTSQNFSYTPRLRIIEEQYGIDNVTVAVKWTQHNDVTYTAKVSPMVPLMSVGETSRQLSILYNTEYNFSVGAATLCRPNVTNSTIIHYVNCGHPEVLSTARNESVPKVVSTEDLTPVEGKTVTFSCPPGFKLIGFDTVTCTENGKWEPDPSGLICNNSISEENINDAEDEDPGHTFTSLIIGITVSMAAVILIFTMTVVIIIAVVFHRKGFRNKRQHTESSMQRESVTAMREDCTTQYQGQQSHPEPDALVYADVTVATKHKKRKKPQQILTTTATHDQTHDLDVQYSAINHNLTTCDNKKQGNEEEMIYYNYNNNILEVTLDTLLTLLREKIDPKWREFGEAVGIDDAVLDSIEKTTFSDNCIVEVLDYWLKYSDGRPTWKDVAEALYDIDLEELAMDIENGKFPSEAETYVNVTTAMLAVKPSAQMSHPPAMKKQYKASLESDGCKHRNIKNPPPVATKPKPGTDSDAPIM